MDPADFPRFKELGVIADFQLEWAKREPATEGPIEPYLGPERYRYLYPAGSLQQAGATIIGGSDWDISSYNPSAPFKQRSPGRAARGKSRSISRSVFRSRRRSTRIPSTPPTP